MKFPKFWFLYYLSSHIFLPMKKLIVKLLVLVAAIPFLLSCNKKTINDEPSDTSIIAWAVGEMDTNDVGMVLYTDDAGETWERQGDSSLFGGIGFSGVYAIDRNNAWIVGNASKIFRTIDGGINWIPVIPPSIPGNPNLIGISIINNNTIWICGDRGTVFSSTDAGNNWMVYDSTFFRRGLMQGIHVITPNIIYVVGEYFQGGGALGYVSRTLNGGTTWDSIHLPNGYNAIPWIGVSATDSNNVVFNGRTGHIAYTWNGGNTWVTPDSISPGDVNDLVMLSNESYWAVLDDDQIFKTFDNGKSWVQQQSDGPADMFLTGIDTYYSQTALVVGQSGIWERKGKILKTTNGGFNWYIRHTAPARLLKVAFAKNQPN
jgi:photosystem II stability/assembly factor-like uncharacterized protein